MTSVAYYATVVAVVGEDVLELLRAEPDPINRAAQALLKVREANDLIEELNRVRAEAIYEVYKLQGATRTAQIFDRSRSNIHRIIRPIQARDPEWQAIQQRRAETFDAVMQQMHKRISEMESRRDASK